MMVIPSRLWIYLAAMAVATLIVGGIYAYGYQRGAASERLAVLTRSVDVLRQRNQTDAEIRNMDRAELCAALGGRMSDDGTCE